MSGLARVARAFLQRDCRTAAAWSYPLGWINAGISVVLWYFITRLVGTPRDYFAFSLIGLAMTQYVWRGFSTFVGRLKAEQANGALEWLWVTAYPLPLLVLLSSVWDFLAATVNAAIVLLIGRYAFGVPIVADGIPVALGIGLLTAVAMGSLGLLLVAVGIASDRGEWLRPLTTRVIPLFSGAFFPIALLPTWLQAFAWSLPTTHAMVLVRGLLLPSAEIPSPRHGAALVGLTLLLAAAGWGTLALASRQARLNGRLAAA